MPTKQKKTRWQIANENFTKQIKHFQAETGMSVEQIAARCNVSRGTMYNYVRDCTKMPKFVERYLTLLFEEQGMHYDPTLGEGTGA